MNDIMSGFVYEALLEQGMEDAVPNDRDNESVIVESIATKLYNENQPLFWADALIIAGRILKGNYRSLYDVSDAVHACREDYF